MLFTILKKTLGPFGLMLVIIIALMMGRSRFPFLRNIPSWVLIVAVVAVIVGWLGFLFVKWYTEKRRAASIEEGILNQAQAGLDQAAPARRAKIEELNKNLAEALTMLKQGPQGKKALYSLPWYMIIGQPSAGKTVAIKNSNLNFPGMTTAKRMKGAGGTRSCDWWFSTDAILLDTAGRYVDGADRSETEDEWFGFLDLLKSHRKNGPIDGLVLAYSVEDLFLKDEVGVVDLARDLRQRMDEILDRLGWTFPVYVLFTKCDLISGFTDYFSSLSPLERHQAWGAVYSPEPEGDQRAAERFTEEFDLLLANLRNTRPHRMSSVSRSEDWGRVFMFPEELASLKAKMVLLIETLFEANPYRKDVPIFRGTYFSSGKQEGKPFDLVVQKIQSMLGVRSEFEGAEVQEEKEDAYFVRDLFAKVLKTDRDLVRVTGKAARSRARLALIASTGFLVLGVLACVWIGVSYGRLRNRMDQTKNVAEKFVNQEEIGTGIEELEKLEKLREKITGSWRSFPLVVTDSVHVYAQGVYHQALSDRFLIPVEERIARQLRNANSLNAAEVRQALRAELMLLMPEKRDDIGWNAQELTESLYAFGLKDVKDDAEARKQMKSLVTEFLLLERPLPDVSRPNELLRGARRLAETHAPREFFRGIIHEAGLTGDDLTLEALVPDQSILRSRGTIRRAYTRAGWEQTVEAQVRDVKKTWEADNQLIVLAGGDPSPSHPEKEELLKLYENSYPEEWVAFFESVRFKSYANCDDLEPDLRRLLLTGTSPLFTLLREAEDASGLGTGLLGEAASGSGSTANIDAALKPLRNLVLKDEDVPAPLDEFREELKAVYEQVDECANEPDFKVSGSAVRGVRRWLNDFVDRSGNAPMASALRTLMMGPVDLADEALERKVVEEVDREREAARRQLQAEWASAADVFSSRLARTYPFDDRDKYADPGDVVELFGPGGTLAGFAEFSAQSPIRAGRATANALQGAEKIRNNLDMTNDGFQAQFRLQALAVNSTGTARGDENRRKIDTVILTINGEQLKDRLAQTHRDFTWHSKDENLECSLELKSSRSRADIASIGFTGTTWSICKLFDRAQVTETSEGRKVIWPFPEHDIEIEFLLTTREDAEPFFISNSAFRRFSLRPGVHE